MSNVIYCIESTLDKKKYIGKTNNFKLRINQHKSVVNGKHYNPYFQNYYNKYFKGVPFEKAFNVWLLHDNVSDDDVDRLEKEEISRYGTRNSKRGFNLRRGGEGGKISLETRLRMSAAQRSLSKAKPFVYTTSGKFIGHFNSLAEVSEKLWLNKNAVNNAYNRGIRYKNYVFLRIPAEEGYKYIARPTGKRVEIFVFNKNKEFIESIVGMSECAKRYNINLNTINTACNREKPAFGQFYFSRRRSMFDAELGAMA